MVRPHTYVHLTLYNKPLTRLNTMSRYKGRASLKVMEPMTLGNMRANSVRFAMLENIEADRADMAKIAAVRAA